MTGAAAAPPGPTGPGSPSRRPGHLGFALRLAGAVLAILLAAEVLLGSGVRCPTLHERLLLEQLAPTLRPDVVVVVGADRGELMLVPEGFDGVRRRIDRSRRRCAAACERAGVGWLDLLPALRACERQPVFLPGSAPLGAEGHDVVARELECALGGPR